MAFIRGKVKTRKWRYPKYENSTKRISISEENAAGAKVDLRSDYLDGSDQISLFVGKNGWFDTGEINLERDDQCDPVGRDVLCLIHLNGYEQTDLNFRIKDVEGILIDSTNIYPDPKVTRSDIEGNDVIYLDKPEPEELESPGELPNYFRFRRFIPNVNTSNVYGDYKLKLKFTWLRYKPLNTVYANKDGAHPVDGFEFTESVRVAQGGGDGIIHFGHPIFRIMNKNELSVLSILVVISFNGVSNNVRVNREIFREEIEYDLTDAHSRDSVVDITPYHYNRKDNYVIVDDKNQKLTFHFE